MCSFGVCIRLISLFLLLPPSLPIPTWTGPGVLEVRFEAGALHYQRTGHAAVFLPCDSPCVLKRGGDALYSPEAGAALWTQDANGGTSERVLIPPNPFRHEVVLPIIAMAP